MDPAGIRPALGKDAERGGELDWRDSLDRDLGSRGVEAERGGDLDDRDILVGFALGVDKKWASSTPVMVFLSRVGSLGGISPLADASTTVRRMNGFI